VQRVHGILTPESVQKINKENKKEIKGEETATSFIDRVRSTMKIET
jgi:hypothetical protein